VVWRDGDHEVIDVIPAHKPRQHDVLGRRCSACGSTPAPLANGRPIDAKTDYDDWRRLLQSAGVRHVRLHDGRHTAATLLLSENVHPRVVMELLGHTQMRTTMNIYSHVTPALARVNCNQRRLRPFPRRGTA